MISSTPSDKMLASTSETTAIKDENDAETAGILSSSEDLAHLHAHLHHQPRI